MSWNSFYPVIERKTISLLHTKETSLYVHFLFRKKEKSLELRVIWGPYNFFKNYYKTKTWNERYFIINTIHYFWQYHLFFGYNFSIKYFATFWVFVCYFVSQKYNPTILPSKKKILGEFRFLQNIWILNGWSFCRDKRL